ncbi:hypothetical protein [Escherichia coli]
MLSIYIIYKLIVLNNI